jgi:hypothetical protein
MLKALSHHPLIVGMVEVLLDATRYLAIVAVVLLLEGQLTKIAL